MSEQSRNAAQWDELQRLRNELSVKDREISNLRIERHAASLDSEDFEAQNNALQGRLQALTGDLAVARGELSRTRDELEIADEQVRRIVEENDKQDDVIAELENTVALGDETVDAVLKCYAGCFQAGYEATQELIATRDLLITALEALNTAMYLSGDAVLVSEQEIASMRSKVLDPPRRLPDAPLPSLEDMKQMAAFANFADESNDTNTITTSAEMTPADLARMCEVLGIDLPPGVLP